MATGEQGLPQAPLLSSLSLVVGNLLPVWAVWALALHLWERRRARSSEPVAAA